MAFAEPHQASTSFTGTSSPVSYLSRAHSKAETSAILFRTWGKKPPGSYEPGSMYVAHDNQR